MVKLVEKKYVGTATTRFLFGWLGIRKKGPYEYLFDDGVWFRPYPISSLTQEWSNILRGSSDVTGTKFMPYIEALVEAGELERLVPQMNWLELKYTTFTAKEGDPSLKRIRDYDGALATKPELWPEPYKSAYLESH